MRPGKEKRSSDFQKRFREKFKRKKKKDHRRFSSSHGSSHSQVRLIEIERENIRTMRKQVLHDSVVSGYLDPTYAKLVSQEHGSLTANVNFTIGEGSMRPYNVQGQLTLIPQLQYDTIAFSLLREYFGFEFPRALLVSHPVTCPVAKELQGVYGPYVIRFGHFAAVKKFDDRELKLSDYYPYTDSNFLFRYRLCLIVYLCKFMGCDFNLTDVRVIEQEGEMIPYIWKCQALGYSRAKTVTKEEFARLFRMDPQEVDKIYASEIEDESGNILPYEQLTEYGKTGYMGLHHVFKSGPTSLSSLRDGSPSEKKKKFDLSHIDFDLCRIKLEQYEIKRGLKVSGRQIQIKTAIKRGDDMYLHHNGGLKTGITVGSGSKKITIEFIAHQPYSSENILKREFEDYAPIEMAIHKLNTLNKSTQEEQNKETENRNTGKEEKKQEKERVEEERTKDGEKIRERARMKREQDAKMKKGDMFDLVIGYFRNLDFDGARVRQCLLIRENEVTQFLYTSEISDTPSEEHAKPANVKATKNRMNFKIFPLCRKLEEISAMIEENFFLLHSSHPFKMFSFT